MFFGAQSPLQSDFPFDRLRPDLYKVYVSLGTVFNNKPAVFRKIMQGLDRPEFQVIVSAGGAYPQLNRAARPANVLLFPSVPQVDLLPRVDLVIGHGGNNSTNETLAAGKPLLVLPVGGEQGDNASRVQYCGPACAWISGDLPRRKSIKRSPPSAPTRRMGCAWQRSGPKLPKPTARKRPRG